MFFEKYKDLKGSFQEWSKLANQVGYDGPGLNSQEPYKYIFNVGLQIENWSCRWATSFGLFYSSI